MKKKADAMMKGGRKGREYTIDYDPYTDPDWYNQGYIYGGVIPRDPTHIKIGDDPDKSKLSVNYNVAQDHAGKLNAIFGLMNEYDKNKNKYDNGLGNGNGDGGDGDGDGSGVGGKGFLNRRNTDNSGLDGDGKGKNRGKKNDSALKGPRGSEQVSLPAIKGNDALTQASSDADKLMG